MKERPKIARSHVGKTERVSEQKVKPPKPLPAKQEIFAQKKVQGLNNTQAAIAAGFSEKCAATMGSRLYRNERVLNRIALLQERATERVIEKVAVDRAWILERLIQNAERAMQAEAVTDREGNKTGEYRYEGQVANRALELLGKEHGMFVERIKVTDLEKMSEADLEALARGELPAKLKLA